MESMEIADDKKITDIFKWDDSSTRLLLTLYKDAVRDFGKKSHLKTKHQLWVHIIEEMSKYGYFVNPKQAQNRLVTLERSYKKRQSEPKKIPNNSISALFDDEIKAIMDGRRHAFPGNDLNELLSENSNSFDDAEYVNLDPSDSNDNCGSGSSQPVVDLSRWDPDSTKAFLTAYLSLAKNPSKKRKFKSKGQMWQYITKQINSRGYDFTPRQTQNRYGTLIRAYRKYLEKKRSGIRSFFLFEAEVREIIKNRITVLDPAGQNEWSEYDDEDLDENEDIDVKFISVEEASIDNIAINSESENSQSEFPQSNANHSSSISYSTENYDILNELKLLRKSETQYQQKIAKIEEEKLDLMRQNNILLKVLIEKLSKS